MDRNKKRLDFVLRHYAPGLFDTRRALSVFRQTHPSGRRTNIFRIIGLSAAAAGVALLLALGVNYYNRQASAEILLSASDGKEVFMLPDSSEVTLYPHSTLAYDRGTFGKGHRRVRLTGKARFSVSPDSLAPFVAVADMGCVRVLGTRFTVDAVNPDSTGVEVESGRVLFTAAPSDTCGVVLTRGMHASLLAGEAEPRVDTPSAADAATTPSPLVFNATPLSEVLKTLSGRFGVKLSCEDTARLLTAEFDTDSLDEIVALIEKTLDVKIIKEGK